jgi:hypothetical protein
MSFDRIDTVPPVADVGTADGRRPPAGPLTGPAGAPAGARETAAHKLRARGFSYRRIAEILRERYDVVSRWLGGAPPAAPIFHDPGHAPRIARAAAPVPAPTPGAVPGPAPAPAGAVLAAVADAAAEARARALEQRVADLMATLRQMAAENREREARLHKILEDERRAAAERETRFKEEVEGMRALVEGLFAPETPGDDPGEARVRRTEVADRLWGRLGSWKRTGLQ